MQNTGPLANAGGPVFDYLKIYFLLLFLLGKVCY